MAKEKIKDCLDSNFKPILNDLQSEINSIKSEMEQTATKTQQRWDNIDAQVEKFNRRFKGIQKDIKLGMYGIVVVLIALIFVLAIKL